VPAAQKREGDGASPIGAWPLIGGWWRADRLARPCSRLPLGPAGPCDGWSDDPEDPAYNAAVRLPHPFSAESLRRTDPLYDIVIATGHNRPTVPGAGSAIFLHCWRAPRRATAGCVALSRPRLLWVLAHLRPGARLVICRSIFSVARETLILRHAKQAATGDAP
jgi:L,D-peptidoglycan transpeptidase YkuD (ErfK/YbiS/YcfS/YnhG family)